MGIVEDIAAIRARLDLDEDGKRPLIYALKVAALLEVIRHGTPRPRPIKPLLGRTIRHEGYSFRINNVSVTPQPALFLDVTFTKPPAAPATHQITIVNPPVLPRIRTGNEKEDLITAIREMLEGFV